MRIRYYIKCPSSKKGRFGIIKDVVDEGKRSYSMVRDDRIDAINRSHLAGRDSTLTKIELSKVIEALYKAGQSKPMSFSEDNLKLFEAYWKEEYATKDSIDPTSAKNDYKRALEALGTLSLLSASSAEIQKALSPHKGNKHRRLAANIKRLLKYAGRNVKINGAKKERRKLHYLTKDDLALVLSRTPEPFKWLFAACFVTGGRVGEVFALTERDPKSVFIDRQIDRNGLSRDTKTGKEVHAPILPYFQKEFESWLKYPEAERLKIRNTSFAKILKDICISLFSDPVKHCTVHDLRHSYAVHLIGKGISISLISQCLGNSVTVCQEYYAGFVLTPENIEIISAKLTA